jgi:DNA polymerase III sliding clamp (beta) subunit (PCNA family)
MTIGVFARSASVTTSALRFYDDCGLVRPASVDAVTGYRYYSLEQLDEVILIRSQRSGTVSLGGRILAEAIRQVIPAVEVTGEFPVLGGVLVEVAAGEVRLVATDRYRMAIRSLRAERQRCGPAAAVIAATHLEQTRRWIGEQAGVQLRFTGTQVRVEGPDGERVLPAIEETFPAYRIILENLPAPVTQVVAPRGLLLQALGSDPDARLDLAVDSGLRISSSARQEPSVVVPADITGEPQAVSFRFTTLYPALTAGIGPDVMVQISRPDLPVVVRSADDSDFTTMVMPVKAASGPDTKESREQSN